LSSIKPLISGYHRFRAGYFEANRERLAELARRGQSPKVAIVSCCDSRVDPSVITDSIPGELFVIRNVANLVPPCEGAGIWHGTSAALEFAVCGLNVEHLIILGHARCGGIRSLLEGQGSGLENEFISSWMSIVADACKTLPRSESTLDEQAHACELGAIEISLANLQTFPWIRQRVEQRCLQLHGWYYDMMTGEVLRFDAEHKGFIPL